MCKAMRLAIGALALGALGWTGAAPAAETIKPADQRFAASDVSEAPHFQRHVLPLLGRLGCNGRACHGSFQGQGGFRLSLFGYDFQADHEALTKGDEPRVDLKDPPASLMLQKPTGTEDDHGGGHRLDVDSWQYRLLLRWIDGGAKSVDQETEPHFVRLEVTPAEIVFSKEGETARLRVVSHWSDGTAEDVTPLCRFQTNDESIATVDESGRITVVGKGDTHVVAFYDNGVVPVPVLLPVTGLVGSKYPGAPTPTRIDELVVNKLRKLGIVPSDLCTDAEFLRRASLDICGQLPAPEEVKAFLADTRPDKRDRKIDELLQRPAYAAWWATKLCDLTGNNERNAADNYFRGEVAERWYRWMHRRVAENAPYDEIIEGLVMAVSRQPGQSYEDFCREMSAYFRRNDPADFTERDTMPYYWGRRNLRQANEKALSFSHAFLGVRLQCAECHKHPFDQWSQEDFRHFTAFFTGITYGNRNEDRSQVQQMTTSLIGEVDRRRVGNNQVQRMVANEIEKGKVGPFAELYVNVRTSSGARSPGSRRDVGGSRVITPRVLGGEEVITANYDDPRQPLMDWLRSPDNPYFAQALVNRVWAHYFNVGIVDPPDDMNLANAPSNRELLDYLAGEFVRQGYDMKWLHREIARSRAYQASWQTNETNKLDVRNFSHAVPRRLPAEVVYDAVAAATGGQRQREAMYRDPVAQCAIGLSQGYYQGAGRSRVGYALTVFGKPMRETPCDCERSNEATLLQTVFLRNDSELLGMIERRDGWLAETLRSGTPQPPSRASYSRSDAESLERRIAAGESMLRQARKSGDKQSAQRLEERLAEARQQLARLRQRGEREPAQPDTAAAAPDVDGLINEAYLRTLSRPVGADELADARRYVAEAKSVEAGLRDVLWALLNTKEFVVNH